MKRNVSSAHSQGERSPTRRAQRRSNSVSSTRSNGSVRLSTLIQQHKNMEQENNSMDSFVMTPPGKRRSILSNNTAIEIPRRKSWWKQIGENSTNILELENQVIDPNNVLEEMDIEILSQEGKNCTMDLPESSDNETINSIVISQRNLFTQRKKNPMDRFGDIIGTRKIQERKNDTLDLPDTSDGETIKSIVIPQRKLFTQRENMPQDKFGEIIGARESLAKLHDNNKADQVNNVRTKNIFDNQQRTKPLFPAALLISPDKTKELFTEEPKAPIHNIFSNRPTKRKNFYADFILAESEDEITDVAPKIFGFQKKFELKRRASSSSRGMRDPSPTLSYTTDIEMDDWKMLPSSTMVENQLDVMIGDGNTPKKGILSKLAEIDSDSGSNATKQSNKSVPSKNESISRKSKTFTKEKSPDSSVTTRNNLKLLQKDAQIDNDGKADTYRKSKTFIKEQVSQVDNEEILDQNRSTKGTEQTRRSKTFTKENVSQVDNEEIFDQSKSTKGAEKSRKSKTFTKEQAIDLETSTINNEKTITQSQESQTKSKVANLNISQSSIKNRSLKNNSFKQVLNSSKSNNKDQSKRNSEKVMVLATTERNDDVDELNFTLKYDDDDQEILETNNINNKSKTSISMTLGQKTKVVENEGQENQQNYPNEYVSNSKDCQMNDDANKYLEKIIQNQCVVKNINREVELSSVKNHDKTKIQNKGNIEDNHGLENENEQNVNNQDIEQNTSETEEAMDLSEVLNESEMDNEDCQIENEQNESLEQNESQGKQNESEAEEQNESQEEQIECAMETNESQEEQNESQEKQNESELEEQNESQVEQNECAIEDIESQEEQNVNAIEQNESEADDQNESEAEDQNETKDEEQNESEAEEQNESIVEEQNESEAEEQNESEAEDQNETKAEEQNESEAEEQNESKVEEQNESEAEEQNESEAEEQNKSEVEINESQEVDEIAEEMEQNESETENQEESEAIAESDNEGSQDDVANDSDHQGTGDQAESLEDDNEAIDSGPDDKENDVIEKSNISHDTTGKNVMNENPEAIRNSSNLHLNSSVIRGRNTTVRKTEIIKTMNIHEQSLVSTRESTGFSDGTRNSSADRSEWDSHRVTRKTLRQTFGKDFTPRKSLRALVMEKSAKRQTQNEFASVTTKFPQANSTELPEMTDRFFDDENQPPNEVPLKNRQISLDEFFGEIQKRNRESRLKADQVVRDMFAPQQPTSSILFKVPLRPVTRRAKPAPKVTKPKRSANQLDSIPEELLKDMNYRPPKRFAPRDAPWATKRLYKYLETKLEPKYDYKARVRAEQLVESIYHFTKGLRRLTVADRVAVDTLKREMARLNVVRTHFEFYEFMRQYLPREVRIKVNPDLINKIPQPREGVFADIIS